MAVDAFSVEVEPGTEEEVELRVDATVVELPPPDDEGADRFCVVPGSFFFPKPRPIC